MEMREAVAPDENKWNAESTQMHHFSEKARFDKSRYTNAQKAMGAAATPGDTSSYETLTPASSETAPGQTHGALHHSPDTLKQARPRGPGEFDDTQDVRLAEEIQSKPAEEAAANGQRTLPGSQGGKAPGQWRGYHICSWAGQQQGQEGAAEMGIDPSIKFTPSEEPEGAGELDSTTSRRPDPPDERAPEIHEEPGGQPSARGAPSPTGAQFQGGSVGNTEVGRSSYCTWARRLPLPGVSSSCRGMRTQVVVRASGGPQLPKQEGGDSKMAGTSSGSDTASHADQASRMPPNVGAASRPIERSAEEPELGAGSTRGAASESDVEGAGADAVMERRVDDPEVGGIAS